MNSRNNRKHFIQITKNKNLNNNSNNNILINWLNLHLIKPFKTILFISIHFIFHLIQFYLIKPLPSQISHSSTPINSFYLPLKSSDHSTRLNSFYSTINNLFFINFPHHLNPNPIDHPLSIFNNLNKNNNSSAILITNNADLNSLTLQLALNFAAIGYHVFLQVSTQSQLTQLIIRWQRIKSKLNKSFNNLHSYQPHHSNSLINRLLPQILQSNQQPIHHQPPTIGTIIPLLYLTPDVPQRMEAISTITAYVRENDIDMISLINIIEPYRIRKSYTSSLSPTSPSFGLSRSSPFNPLAPSPHTSPSASSTRPLTGITSPTASDHSNNLCSCSPPTTRTMSMAPSTSLNYELYDSPPLPLSISSDVYLFDAFGDTLLGPLSTIQDLLLLLKNHRGRVINIWDGNRYPQTGLANILLEGFQKTNQIIKAELDKLLIPVSIVYAPTDNSSNSEDFRSTQRIVTNDSRSLLSDASDPDLLQIFTQQAEDELRQEENCNFGSIASDLITSFNLVRLVLETNYPSQVYPIGIKEVIDQLTQLSGFNRVYSGFENFFKF